MLPSEYAPIQMKFNEDNENVACMRQTYLQ